MFVLIDDACVVKPFCVTIDEFDVAPFDQTTTLAVFGVASVPSNATLNNAPPVS